MNNNSVIRLRQPIKSKNSVITYLKPRSVVEKQNYKDRMAKH